jgi:hypothetical protein
MAGDTMRGRLAGLGVAACLLFGATQSWGQSGDDSPCVVQVTPQRVSNDWRRAAVELRQRVRQCPAPDRDCRELLVEVGDDGAQLTITTKDGRQARRLVAAPSALIPAASALAVSVEAAVPPPSVGDSRAPEQSVKGLEPATNRPGAVFLGGGLRVAAPGVFWAPVLRGAASLSLRGWEFGTWVDVAPLHWLAADEIPPRFSMWSLSSGITAGRREPVGAVDLLAGLMFGAAFVHQQSTTEEFNDGELEIDEEEGDGVDLQLGGYLGIATPRRENVRFRAQVEFALPLSHAGKTRELDSDLPPLPGFAVTAVLGVELGAP